MKTGKTTCFYLNKESVRDFRRTEEKRAVATSELGSNRTSKIGKLKCLSFCDKFEILPDPGQRLVEPPPLCTPCTDNRYKPWCRPETIHLINLFFGNILYLVRVGFPIFNFFPPEP